MRRIHILSLTFFLGILILTACESELEPKDFIHSPQMAVHCYFTPGKPWEMTINRSGNILTDDLTPDWVEGAIITISGDDGSFTDLFQYSGFGTYYCDHVLPKAGVQYTLNIRHPDFPEISSTDKIPDKERGYDLSLNLQDAEGKTWMLLTLKPVDQKNFSNLIISNSIKKTYLDESGAPLVFEEMAFLMPDDKSLAQFQFNDKSNPLRQKLFLKELTNESFGMLSQGGYRKSSDIHLVEGLSVWQFYFCSDAFFRYNWIAFASEPFQAGDAGTVYLKYDAYTNIHNGYGIFAGYNIETYETTF